MKTRFLYILLFFTALIWSACEKHDYADGVLSPITSLQDVRNLYKGSDVTLTKENLVGAYQIVGIVISDPDAGNAPSGTVVLQNNRRKKIRGISLAVESASDYHVGDSLVVNIEGSVLKKVNGSLQITGLADGAIRKVSSNNPDTIQTVSSYTVNLHPDVYESTLVRIVAGVVTPSPFPDGTYSGDKVVMNGADSLILHTEASANFASSALPGSATFTGILLAGQSSSGEPVLQLWPRNIDDITDPVAPVDPNAPKLGKSAVIITGFVNDAKGGDGNYEYFQFMATEDIDFGKTPMAVVTCTNAGSAKPYEGAAPGGGWATGGGRTYKFNLTSGMVNKGEIFYVGGSYKKINGPNSTDISSAKWIRDIEYTTTGGDGFGDKSGGLLPNSGNAGGIAIFEGTTVAENSIPVDAVFFGGKGKTTIVDSINSVGYRVPENDHYNPVNPETSAEQPFFYEGSNYYVIPHLTPADQGVFVKLGGNFNAETKTWVTPRSYVYYIMTKESALSEIETGDDVTILSGD